VTAKRSMAPFGGDSVLRRGAGRARLADLYYRLLTGSRAGFAAVMIGTYLGLNGLFALAYLACGDGIENARPGSFADVFFFSVQTMATIGYGKMVPISLAANLLVTAEAGIGLFGVAVAAGLMFARFTRVDAGIRFSRAMVVNRHDGLPTLMFRLANERVDAVHEARVHLVLATDRVTTEGQSFRQLLDVPPVRSFTPVFGLTWTVMHVIDEVSPLFGLDPREQERAGTAITVLFSGHHDGLQQPVHARYTYDFGDILWGYRFQDVLQTLPDGRRAIDYDRFDEVEQT